MSRLNAPSNLRTDRKRQSCQSFSAKRCSETYFSPPRRPWDLLTFSQPKRLWELTPPYRREIQGGNNVSAPPSEVPKEKRHEAYHEIRTICGLFPNNPGIGRKRWPSDQLRRECQPDPKETEHSKSSQSTSDQIKVSVHDVPPRMDPWLHGMDPSIEEANQNISMPLSSPRPHGTELTEKKKFIRDHTEQLIAKGQRELEEIENMKVQMMLYEKLAWDKVQGEVGKGCMTEVTRLKALQEPGKLLDDDATIRASERNLAVDAAQNLDVEGSIIDRHSSQAWKAGLCTLLQTLFWYFCMIQPIIRSIKSPHFVPPT
ncbi:hypothetical protein MPTK2_7g03820 [Marchantia polymorpha subsp. ruderalis]